jgi:hypothetical protein
VGVVGLVDMVAVRMMQIAVVEVVDVARMADRDVSAVGPVLTAMSLVNLVIAPPGGISLPIGSWAVTVSTVRPRQAGAAPPARALGRLRGG